MLVYFRYVIDEDRLVALSCLQAGHVPSISYKATDRFFVELGVSTITTLHINNTNMAATEICEVGVTTVSVNAGLK